MKKILIVDDDRMILDSVCDILRTTGYQVFAAENYRQMERCCSEQAMDLIILDVQLNGENGFELCEKLRRTSRVPVLFLTAYGSEDEIVRGFKSGGDDYLTKPFRLREFLARVEALLRRHNGDDKAVLKSEFLTIEPDGRVVRLAGEFCELTDTESKIVLCLMENYPHTVVKRNLEEYVWGIDSAFVDQNTLSVHISRLREKLGEEDWISTVRGRGYRWNKRVERW